MEASSGRSRRCGVGRTTMQAKNRRTGYSSNPPGEGTSFGVPPDFQDRAQLFRPKKRRRPGGRRRSPRSVPDLVAPVEVAGAIDLPETGILDLACGRVLRGLLAGPREVRLRSVDDEV